MHDIIPRDARQDKKKEDETTCHTCVKKMMKRGGGDVWVDFNGFTKSALKAANGSLIMVEGISSMRLFSALRFAFFFQHEFALLTRLLRATNGISGHVRGFKGQLKKPPTMTSGPVLRHRQAPTCGWLLRDKTGPGINCVLNTISPSLRTYKKKTA